MAVRVVMLVFATGALLATGSPVYAAGETATAVMKLADGKDAGLITLTEATSGVLIKFDLKGLPPGKHGLQVHETGKCEADFVSAGGIYNPLGAKHGFLDDEGPMAGDLPNIYAAADGTAVGEVLSPFLTLSKEAEETLFDNDKTAILVFAKGDNYTTDPDGEVGPRIACGVVVAK